MNLLRTASVVSIFTLLSRITGLVRESLMARALGTTIYADAVSAAFKIPNLLQNLLGEGTLSAAFIPEYTRSAHQQPRPGESFAGHDLSRTQTGKNGRQPRQAADGTGARKMFGPREQLTPVGFLRTTVVNPESVRYYPQAINSPASMIRPHI